MVRWLGSLVVREGDSLGMVSPVTRSLYRLVRIIEQGREAERTSSPGHGKEGLR